MQSSFETESKQEGLFEANGKAFRVLFHLIKFTRTSKSGDPMEFEFGRMTFTQGELFDHLVKRENRTINRIKLDETERILLVCVTKSSHFWETPDAPRDSIADFVAIGDGSYIDKPWPDIIIE